MALCRLAASNWSGELYHLPGKCLPGERYDVAPQKLLPGVAEQAPGRLRLADVWGKTLVSLKLPSFSLFDARRPPKAGGEVSPLPEGVQVKRTSPSESGVLVTLSDGTELACSGVLFADGSDSQGKLFWTHPSVVESDKQTVRCWLFEADNLLEVKDWEFRWAAGKSVELFPASEGKLLVKLRFKSPFGGDLSVAELRELYSEFGSDMTALFENLETEKLHAHEERSVENPVFVPAAGCLALGRAAWNPDMFLCWGWLARFVDAQLEVILEQLLKGSLSCQSFEAQSKELLAPMAVAEQFVRRQLHLDNPFLRAFRGVLMALLPNSVMAGGLRSRLLLQ